eukprot:scaffold118713_cov35-Prasinocladus_malaysianus.AAC.1
MSCNNTNDVTTFDKERGMSRDLSRPVCLLLLFLLRLGLGCPDQLDPAVLDVVTALVCGLLYVPKRRQLSPEQFKIAYEHGTLVQHKANTS